MGVSIPSSYSHDIVGMPTLTVGSVGPVGPVTVAGIPDKYEVRVKELPTIKLDIEPVEIKPLDVSVRLKEIPAVRVHVPSHHCIGFSLFGVELAKIEICGEAQVITEPYRPNPCEVCGTPSGATVPGRLVGTTLTVAEG